MNILLTNDDGFDAPGIRVLFEKLKKYGNVVIVAPDKPMSAKSVSITIGKALHVIKHEDNIFSVDGTPADCAALGLTALNMEFDLVVSGCNNGWNVCYDTVFSGTIGACVQSIICHKPSIAFSNHDGNFEIADKYFDDVFSLILDKKLFSKEYILNVNFPKDDVKGIKICKEHNRQDKHFFVEENGGLMAYRYVDKENFIEDTDWWAIHNGYISICPINPTYYSDSTYINFVKDHDI